MDYELIHPEKHIENMAFAIDQLKKYNAPFKTCRDKEGFWHLFTFPPTQKVYHGMDAGLEEMEKSYEENV